ncbi:MAG: hypothetical protein KIT22_11685 [Verrucomicrobiae bacterium]|nr:hypothetical protein [Verrucomicrobiae bacterium]
MISRAFLAAVAVFWAVMNFLLWRAEFGRGRSALSDVPLRTVVDRVLNAPDPSVLVVRHRGESLGLLRWIPTVTESGPAGGEESSTPEGMVEATGYQVDADLNLNGSTPSERWRVLTHLELDTNYVWKELSVRLFQRPANWEIIARAGDDRILLRYEEGRNSWEQWFSWRDLKQAGSLLGPYAALLPEELTSGLSGLDPGHWRDAIQWQARNDWLQVGRNRVRTFRIEATVLNQYQASVQVSRAGELLQIRLPDQLQLSNEALPLIGGSLGNGVR